MTSAAAAFAPAPPAGAPAVAAAPVPAAAPAPIAAGPAAAPAANAPAWFDGFQNPDVKSWATAKGFKDPEAVTESAYNLEKLIGFEKAGRTLVIPKDDATPAEKAAFNLKLGVPATAAEYKLPLPEGHDPKLNETIQGWMHKAGATPSVAASLTEQFVAFSAAQKTDADKALLDLSDKAFATTTTKWGAEAQANLELGKRFTANLLPDQVTLDNGEKLDRQTFLEKLFNTTGATGAMLELFAKAGRGLGEHAMRTGAAPPANDSPAGAQARIAALKADAVWVKAYLGGDKDKVAEMTRLTAQAFPNPI